ncbi:response regulator transcription factor [Nodosilinea nodulosa]|uniref:response regulator transcription factor n=1 Tax=Nodosilinea nodulosa TaxID=416001 RepID=UPI000A0107D9|nr:response regulator transcription factor [Nodosilinea nodulosa]
MASTSAVSYGQRTSLERSAQAIAWDKAAINQALATVAQEVTELVTPYHSGQPERAKYVEMVMIRAVDPEHRKSIAIASLTARELEVLQLIVDGCNNSMIAKKLYITTGTVKSHVRNVLSKLCVSDRTQAAIRALRSGLVH